MFARRTSSTASASPSSQRLFKLPVFQLLALSVLLGFSAVSQAATFTVNTTTDTNDSSCSTSIGGCSLRDAVTAATTNGVTADTIAFNIPQSDGGYNASIGVYTLTLSGGALPVLPANTTVDGTTQTSIANTNLQGPEIEVTGSTYNINLGFSSPNGNCTVKGLILNGFASPVHFASVNNRVLGCYIGTDYTGVYNSPNNNKSSTYVYGVNINSGGNSNYVGGLAPGEENKIGFSGYNEVRITGSARYNRVRGNSIFGNVGIGIDLVDDGISYNDVGDADTGANERQNFPAITAVVPGAGSTQVSLSLNSAPSKAYNIDLYRAGAANIHANGFGDGKFYAGSTTLNTDASGNGTAIINVAGTFPSDSFVATATDPTGNTSEFSYAVKINAGYVVTNTKDSGPGSLRGTIAYAIAYPASTIAFNIPNTDSGFDGTTYNIKSATNLPSLPSDTNVDGTTQPGNSNPNGPEIQMAGDANFGLILNNNSTVKGLIVNGFSNMLDIEGSNNTILGCYLGTTPTGKAASPNNNRANPYNFGIWVNGFNNTIGGITPGQGNVIGYAGECGVRVIFGNGNRIRGNSITDNGSTGITVGDPASVTKNDVGDADTGANNLQNFPVITSVIPAGSNTSVNVSLNSEANKTYTIDFYRSALAKADPSGFGEGETFVGSTNLTTNASGNGSVTVVLSGLLGTDIISATATDAGGNTSEFGPSAQNGSLEPWVVVNTSDDGPGSLRKALSYASYFPNTTITFKIPTSDGSYNASTGVWTISPLSPLPYLSVGTVIDGTTQPGNTNVQGPEIEINGAIGGLYNCFFAAEGSNTIRGLIINGFAIPIYIFSPDNRIESCYIGTDFTGTQTSPHNAANYRFSHSNGVYVAYGNNNVIGGDTPDKGNIIGFTNDRSSSNENGNGIYIAYSYNSVRNNTILGNYKYGINIAKYGDGNNIRDNVIRDNGKSGVGFSASDFGVRNTIRFNSIYNNVGLGIDIGNDGVTANDAGETDSIRGYNNGNHGQNFPVLTYVNPSNGNITVSGTLNTRPNMAAVIDFYANDTADSSGYGEGRTYLGSTTVTTNGTGNADFTTVLNGTRGNVISSTATIIDNPNNPNDNEFVGNTSEFSNNLTFPSGVYLGQTGYLISESTSTSAGVTVIRAGSTAGPLTVNYTTSGGTATPGTDYTPVSGTLSWADGDGYNKVFYVPIKSDSIDELDETLNITLSNVVGNSPLIAPSSLVMTIVDDDTAGISAKDISVVEGSGGTKTATFTVSLAAPSDRTVTVNYATANGTATAGSDYTATSGTLSFSPGQTSKTLNVTINSDTSTEASETFFLNLSGATNAPITDAQAVGTITDDDAMPVLSVNSTALAEGNSGSKTMAFTIKLTPASTKAVTFYAKTAPSASTATTEPATASTDFVALPLTAYTFNPGETSKTINVTINGDTIDEANETFNLVLSAPTGATLGTATGIGTITDDDASPSASVNDVTLTEGDAGNQNAAFTVSLSAPSGRVVKVTVATVDVTTTAGADYNGITATELTFLPGQTSKVVNVLVKSDTISEATETFQVKLTNPVNVGFSDPTGVGTIVDNDPIPSISATVTNITEGNSGQIVMPFSIRLSNPSSRAITFKVMTGNASVDAATAGVDYVAVPLTTLTIPAGTIQQVFNVQVNGDLADEVNEKIVLNLTASTNATITTAKVEGIIVDDDNAPSLSVTGGSLDEGNSGTKSLNFTVNLSSPSGKVVTVNFQTGTATAAGTGASTANTDYVAIPSTRLTFAPGEISKTIAVPIKGDIAYEVDESFSGTIGSPVNATVVKVTDAGIIRNDDNIPSLLYYASSVAEGNSGTKTVVLNLNLSAAAGTPVSFTYQTADETALAGEDYVAQTGTVTFTAGQTTRTLSIVTKGDTTFEANERFFVNFVDGDGVSVSVSYPITITNDDNSTARSGGSS